jgi:hypothetical protein
MFKIDTPMTIHTPRSNRYSESLLIKHIWSIMANPAVFRRSSVFGDALDH